MSRMNALQENLYQLLTEIDDICKKYDIQYFLAGGTALGTVRNHRFLPWDDDIDLYITRDNWNKLRHVIETEKDAVPEGRGFAYNENTKYYCNPIPRYIDETTTAIYRSQALPGKACGQHIELLIMDPMPNDEEQRKEFIDLMRVYTELLSPYFVVNKNLSIDDWKRHYSLYKKYLRKIKLFGEEKVIAELEKKLQSFPTDECDDFCMRWGIDTLIYKKEYYGNSRPETFERGKFPVGENAEGIFRIAYGDSWMYVPDYEEQVVHNALQDIEIPYCEYTDKYIPKIERERVFKKYKKNKRSNASVFLKRRKIEMLIAKEKVAVESKYICSELDSKEDYLRSLLEKKDYATLSAEFNDYRSLQFSQFVKKYKIIVPISDKNICTLLLNSIEQGKYYEANKYLNIRRMQDKPFSDELLEVEKVMNACRELSIARYDKKDEVLLKDLIETYEKDYPQLLDIYRAKLWIMENSANSTDDFKAINDLCDETLNLYPFDGETMAIKAKAMMELGNKDEAMELYRKAVDNTRNGIIWQKVEVESGISRIDIERDLIEGVDDED